jgi:hypothetical protein
MMTGPLLVSRRTRKVLGVAASATEACLRAAPPAKASRIIVPTKKFLIPKEYAKDPLKHASHSI